MKHPSASFTAREQVRHSHINLTVFVELGQGLLSVMHQELLRDWVTDHDVAFGHDHQELILVNELKVAYRVLRRWFD